jgi:hypothetical protein
VVSVKRRAPTRTQPEPETAGDLMAGLLSRLGGSGRALEYRVFDAYTRAAGVVLATRSTPDVFRDGTLFVRVTSSALAHEITLLRGEIVERMGATLGPGVVKEIRTRVGGIAAGPGRG